LHNGEGGKSRDIIARYVGVSGATLEKVEAIVEVAEKAPEKYGHLKERLDETGKVNHCYQQLRFAQLAQQKVLARGSRDRATYAPNVVCADCFDSIPTLEDGSVGLVVSSPPYCEQRRGQYAGVSEAEYPQWTTRWMRLLRGKLADDASVLIIIRPHLKNGVLSDYVLRTRLALREDGWKECEELIWLKPDAPPFGSNNRPRRTWESILWFSKTSHPYCDLIACGRESNRLGFAGSLRFGLGGESPISSHQNLVMKNGKSRCPDVFLAHVCEIDDGIDHPAMFPVSLAEQLIRTFSRQGDLVADPFVGAGGTLLAAMRLQRAFLGCDIEFKYVELARQRLAEEPGSLEEGQVISLQSHRNGNGRHIQTIGDTVHRNGHDSRNGRQLARRAK
jgi:DNA modification methylase